MSSAPRDDDLLQPTCQMIVDTVTQAVGSEPPANVVTISLLGGLAMGKQMTIDATDPEKGMNICRLSVLDANASPNGEIVRMEYQHEKIGKFGKQSIYSVQSVRRQGNQLVLLENFLASSPTEVRDEDFRLIQSEQYAQQTVLTTVRDWARYRAWQIQESGKHS